MKYGPRYSGAQLAFLHKVAAVNGEVMPARSEWKSARVLAADGLVLQNMETGAFAATAMGRETSFAAKPTLTEAGREKLK